MVTFTKKHITFSLKKYILPVFYFSFLKNSLSVSKQKFHFHAIALSRFFLKSVSIVFILFNIFDCSAGSGFEKSPSEAGPSRETLNLPGPHIDIKALEQEPRENIPQVIAAGHAFEANDLKKAEDLLVGLNESTEIVFLKAKISELKGNFGQAIQHYRALEGVNVGLETLRIWGLSKVLAGAGQYAEAVVQADILLSRKDKLTSLQLSEIIEYKAKWLRENKQWSDAITTFENAIERAEGRAKERLELDLGRVLILSNDLVRAKSVLEPLAMGARNARTMSSALQALYDASILPSWNQRDQLTRANTLIDLKAWDEASKTVEAPAKSSDKSIRVEAEFLSAKILYSRRHHYKEALTALLPIASSKGQYADEAQFLAARTLSRLNRNEEAINAYFIYAKKTTRRSMADEAVFLAGQLQFYLGQHQAALNTMERLLGKAGKRGSKAAGTSATRQRDIHFIAGISALLLKKNKKAKAYLEAASLETSDGEVLGRNRYWIAVAMLQNNKKAGAQALRRICAEDATSWYAQLALQRLSSIGEDLGSCAVEKITASFATLQQGGVRSLSELSPLAGFLAGAGLFRMAADELHRAEDSDTTKVREADWIHHYTVLEAPHYAIRRAAQKLSWPPKPEERWLADAAYPTPYKALAAGVEKKHGLPKWLIYAIARKESFFDPKVVSSAGALGMMQIMPRTYEANRKLAGLLPLKDGEMPGPEDSIAVAGYELASLSKAFGGNIALTIMAYNSGPAAVSDWIRRSGDMPMDLFVEKAGFDQTRNYVKRVYKNLVRYCLLAGDEPLAIPMKVK